MKKIIAYCLLITMLLCGTGISAFAYAPPYEAFDTNNRIWEQRPEPFSYSTLNKEMVAECNFDTAATSATLTASTIANYWSKDDGAVKIIKSSTSSASNFVLEYAPAGGLTPGEFYAFTCRIKTVGVAGESPKNILACYNGSKWLAEAGKKQTVTGDNDWYTMVQYIEVPNNATSMRLSANLPKELTGTVYFDDFQLEKLTLDPLESVLRAPAYKGLIYGDGDSDIVLDVLILENKSPRGLNNKSLLVQLVDGNNQRIYFSETDDITERMNFVFSSRGLAEGDYYLQTILTDKATGNVISQKEQTIRKRGADDHPKNYIDENGHYVKDGVKTFFTRICNSSSNNNGHYPESAAFAKEVGIDTISNYGTWWQRKNSYTDVLQTMRNDGITSHISFNGYHYSSGSNRNLVPEQTDLPKFFKTVTNDFKNDDVLEGYYLFDEPNPHLVGEEIRWNNQILSELDIDHPTFGVTDKEYDAYGIFTKMADIVGVDPYPVTGEFDSEGNPLFDISKVGKAVRQFKESFPNRPVYYVLQGFRYPSTSVRSPEYAELRNMAWQAICEGAEGLDWYSYHEMINDNTPKSLEEWTTDVKNLMADVEQYEAVILSDEPAPDYTVTAHNGWLNITLRRYNGETYLFAVNNTFKEQKTTVSIKGMSPIHLTFDSLEVKQIKLSQAASESPEAELLSMGFSNGCDIFAVSEGDENTLYVPANSDVINYTAKISEGAKLYIGGVEKPENGKIAVDRCDRFSVTVVAEDGKTKTTKYYNVIK